MSRRAIHQLEDQFLRRFYEGDPPRESELSKRLRDALDLSRWRFLCEWSSFFKGAKACERRSEVVSFRRAENREEVARVAEETASHYERFMSGLRQLAEIAPKPSEADWRWPGLTGDTHLHWGIAAELLLQRFATESDIGADLRTIAECAAEEGGCERASQQAFKDRLEEGFASWTGDKFLARLKHAGASDDDLVSLALEHWPECQTLPQFQAADGDPNEPDGFADSTFDRDKLKMRLKSGASKGNKKIRQFQAI